MQGVRQRAIERGKWRVGGSDGGAHWLIRTGIVNLCQMKLERRQHSCGPSFVEICDEVQRCC